MSVATSAVQRESEADAKIKLLCKAFVEIAKLWSAGDAQNQSWIYENIDAIERDWNKLDKTQLRARLKATYLRLKGKKGAR